MKKCYFLVVAFLVLVFCRVSLGFPVLGFPALAFTGLFRCLSLLFLAFRPFLAAFWVVVALGFLALLLALPFFGDFESLDKASFLLFAAAGFFYFSLTKLRNSLAELERAGRTGTPSLYQDSLAHQAFETQLDATVVFLHIVTCG